MYKKSAEPRKFYSVTTLCVHKIRQIFLRPHIVMNRMPKSEMRSRTPRMGGGCGNVVDTTSTYRSLTRAMLEIALA